jgi:hypothetical protein
VRESFGALTAMQMPGLCSPRLNIKLDQLQSVGRCNRACQQCWQAVAELTESGRMFEDGRFLEEEKFLIWRRNSTPTRSSTTLC